MPSNHPHDPARTIDEQAHHCFGCGPDNAIGLHLTFHVEAGVPDAITATAEVELSRSYEGPPGFVHGGIIATLMDEAMSKLNRPLSVLAMTRHIEVDYLHPVPVDTPLTLRSHHLRRDGRKLFHTAELVNSGGKALARAKGFFLVIDPALLRR